MAHWSQFSNWCTLVLYSTCYLIVLFFISAGLTGAEIQDLSVSAIEGLSSQVIPKIPANTLKVVIPILVALISILTLTAPPLICNRRQFQILQLFQK